MFARSRAIVACLLVVSAAVTAQGPGAAPQSSPSSPPTGGPVRSARNANYTITARLDPASRTLTGDELIAWRNLATVPAASLRLHLYYNAWRNNRSSWMRERQLAGNRDLESRPQEDWGWSDITAVRLIADGGAPVDVTARLRFIAPDDGNQDDRTLAEVPLDAPVPPGGTINV